MAACAPRTTARNNTTNRGYDDANIIQKTRTTTGINKVTKNYKDGVYTGYGDMTSSGRQMAIVTVRNGRIVDVDLTTISPDSNTGDNNRAINAGNNPTTSINNIRTTGTGTTSRTTGINSNTDLRDNNVTGARTTTNKTPNTINSTANNTPGIINRFTRTTTNDTTHYNHNTNNEITKTGDGLTGTITDNTTARNIAGTINNTVDATLTRVRTMLTGSVIQNQGYDFDTSDIITNNTDANTKSSVRNWQLAIRRALDKASR